MKANNGGARAGRLGDAADGGMPEPAGNAARVQVVRQKQVFDLG
ncbi:hypothetical protein [Paracoccus sp. SSK6]